jgi:hypothetical protein
VRAATIDCGDSLCPVDGGVCCDFHDDPRCGEVVDLAPEDGWMREDNPQLAACRTTTTHNRALMGYFRCDESSDCGKGAMCCLSFRPFGRRVLCTPAQRPGASPCENDEVCKAKGRCRTKGTICIDGLCRMPDPIGRCGATACTREAPLCCGKPATCRTMAACEDEWKKYSCSRARECPAGQHCAAVANGSACVGDPKPSQGYHRVCDSDDDCATMACDGGPATCSNGYTGVTWLRSCECP